MLDCELLREVYINLLDVKEPKLNLSSVDQEVVRSTNKEKIYNKNILKVSEVELKKHKEFLINNLEDQQAYSSKFTQILDEMDIFQSEEENEKDCLLYTSDAADE